MTHDEMMHEDAYLDAYWEDRMAYQYETDYDLDAECDLDDDGEAE